MKNYSLRTEDLDIVNKSDLPDTSSFVTTNTAQNISGIKTIYNSTAAPYFILKNHYNGMWTVKGGSSTTPSGGYTLTLPNKTGTIALTSDLPSTTNFVTIADTQTISGAKTFSSQTIMNGDLSIDPNDTDGVSILIKGSAGTSGQVLMSCGEGVTPMWSTISSPTFSYSNNVLTITY